MARIIILAALLLVQVAAICAVFAWANDNEAGSVMESQVFTTEFKPSDEVPPTDEDASNDENHPDNIARKMMEETLKKKRRKQPNGTPGAYVGPDGGQMIPPDIEYDSFGRPKPPRYQRYKFNIPSLLHNVKQNDLVKLQKQYDIVVIFVGHPLHCNDWCVERYDDFLEIANNVTADEGGHIKQLAGTAVKDTIRFAFLDIEKEGDEYADAVQSDDIQSVEFPQILIMKADHQLIARKPPISFVVNDQTAFRLPKFLTRLVGKSPAKVGTEAELVARISHKATERVSVAFWMDSVPFAVEDIIFEQRFQFLFHHLPSPAKADPELVKKYNPNGADIVMYYYKQPNFYMEGPIADVSSVITMDHVSFNKTITGQRRVHDHQHRLFAKVLDLWGAKQPGREFEKIKKITIQNGAEPANCDQRRATEGDKLIGRVVGRIVGSGRSFLDSRDDTFIVGDIKRVDIPNYIMANGFTGMCVGMKRRVAFPPNKAWPAEIRPSAVGEKDRVIFHVEVHRFLEASEVGPDNRMPEYDDVHDPENEL